MSPDCAPQHRRIPRPSPSVYHGAAGLDLRHLGQDTDREEEDSDEGQVEKIRHLSVQAEPPRLSGK